MGYVARNQCHRRLFAVVLSQLLAALVVCACRSGLCTTTSQYTLSFANLVTGADYYQPIYTSFTFPKFDASLGTLQHVNLAFSFSGRVSGTAVVSGQPPLNGLVNHSIFFDFEDFGDAVAIAEPELRLSQSFQTGTLTFGPSFQTSAFSVNPGPGDPRFQAWGNGPGNVNGRLGVWFGNWGVGANDTLPTYHGTDAGVYSGTFSISYDYLPVPEPSTGMLLLGSGLSLALCRYRRRSFCR